jgi:hypothetical protein
MLAYNLNCWLLLFNREKTADAAEMKHIQLSTARLRFLFLAAKIWCHAGRVGVSYSDHYQEKGIFQRLMDRLRLIAKVTCLWLCVNKNSKGLSLSEKTACTKRGNVTALG